MGWPFGGQKKPSAGEEEIVSARPDEDEPVPIAISPISVRSGEDELECGETKIVVFPTPMQLTESSEVGDDPTKGRHDAALRPSSGGAHQMALSFPPHRPGTGSDRGDDRNSRPSSGFYLSNRRHAPVLRWIVRHHPSSLTYIQCQEHEVPGASCQEKQTTRKRITC